MWLATLDIQLRSTQLVLLTLDNKGVPQIVTQRGWRLRPNAGLLIAQLVTWEVLYQRLDALVLSSFTPRGYVRVLQEQRYRLEWVSHQEVEEMASHWRSLRLDARWRRGEWLCSLAMRRLSQCQDQSHWTPWDWVYAGLERQVRVLNPALNGSGDEFL